MAFGLYANLEEESEDVSFEDYDVEVGWPDKYDLEKAPQIDCKFAGHVEDTSEEFKEPFTPPLGETFTPRQMLDFAHTIENVLYEPNLKDEKYRDRLYNLMEWLQYWSSREVSCRTG